MTSRSIKRGLLLHAVFLLAAPAGLATSLGPVEGVPLIGRPLDVSVRVVLDPGADTASACARAEVTQGDSPTSGVTVQLDMVSAQQAVMRVRTFRPVEEPVVTILAHVGCTMPTSRRFVLLADLPAEQPQAIRLPGVPASLASAAAPGSVRVLQGQPVQAQAGAQPLPTQPSRQGRPSVVRRADAEQSPLRAGQGAQVAAAAPSGLPAVKSQPSRRQSVVMKQRAASGSDVASRLKLDPIDLTIEVDPTLKLTQTIERIIEVTPAQRAEAAAALRAMTMPPEEFQKLLTLDTEIRSLRLQVQSGKSEIAALQAQLQKAQLDRTRTIWGFSALSLALLAGLMAALFWRRRQARREQDPLWWNDVKVMPEDDPVEPAIDPAMQETQKVVPQENQENPESWLDLDLSNFDQLTQDKPSAGGHKTPEALSSFGHLDFQPSQTGAWRAMKSEELSDLQEQAEFFVSLGDYDRAVNVLMAHVQASPQTSALAWMALLDLHHRLQRKQGYDGLREQIQRRMNVIVPEFDDYRKETAGLESYADAIGRITALWPSRRVLDVIEEYIYLMPGASVAQPFELAAFQDLLMLHDLAKSVVDDSGLDEINLDAPSSQSDEFPLTNAGPVSAEMQGPSEEDVKLFATLLAGGRVDVNLEDPAARPEQSAGATEQGNLIDFDDFDSATARMAPSRVKNPPR